MKSIKKVFSSLLVTTLLLLTSTAQAATSYWSTITNSGTDSSYDAYNPIGQIIYKIEVEMSNLGIYYNRYRVEINQSNFINNPVDTGADGIADVFYFISGDFDVSISFEFATAADQTAFEQLINNNVWSTETIGNWLAGVDFGQPWQIDGASTLTSATGESDPVFDDLFTTKLAAGVPVEDQPTGEYVWKMDWDVDADKNFQTEFVWFNGNKLTFEALDWTFDITALAYEFDEILDVDDEVIGYTHLSGIDPAEMFPTDIRWAWECEMAAPGDDNNFCRYSNNWYFTNEAAALAMDQWLLDTPHALATHDSEQSQVASFMLDPSLASYPDNVRTRSLADFSGGELPGHMATDYDTLVTLSQMLQGQGFYFNKTFPNELIFTVAQDSDGDGITDNADLNPTLACSNRITVTNGNDSGAGSLHQALIDVCPASTLHAWDYAGIITFDVDYPDADNDGIADAVDLNPTVACSNKITVTNANNSGAGSLRQALIDICPTPALQPWDYAGFITFDADYTIKPLGFHLVIEQNLSIDAAGRNIVIDGDNGVGDVGLFMVIADVTASMHGLTLRNGARSYGAAIINNGDLSIDACHFENNQAAVSGGAIFSTPTGTLNVSRTSFISNISDSHGGAILARGDIAIENSIFAENEATIGDAGAVYVTNDPSVSDVSIVNTTFYENQAGSNYRDAIFLNSGQSPTFNLSNVLIVNSSPNIDCSGIISTNNNNWIQDGSCSATYTGDPELNDPANGDYRPIPSSAAIDAGTNAGAPVIDFAGVARPSNSSTDIGAHEYNPAGDFDGDGYNDTADNCTLASNDQLDTDGDDYGNACDGDLNNDNIVNSLDLGLFKIEFGATGTLDSDMNGDNIVNSLDLGLFRNTFFTQPGPSALVP